MPTTFNVFSLGVLPDMDTLEGNADAENASALVGLTIGSAGNALAGRIQSFSPGSTGFGAGTPDAYNQNNNPPETFRIDGGPDQTFDSVAAFTGRLTYIDGSQSGIITLIIFQDTAGNAYLAPNVAANGSQTALEFAAIRSIQILSVAQNTNISGLAANRLTGNFLTCYVAGTLIATPSGDVPIETLATGDLVTTQDNGAQVIRWIGKSTVTARGNMAPVRIMAGALGPQSPARDLLVSRQHRIMLSSKICQRMFGTTELLVPAIKLTALPGIFVEETDCELTYYHLLTDAHEIIFAEGLASETMLTGPGAMQALGPDYVAEIEAIFPDVTTLPPLPARPIAQGGKQIEKLIARHHKNGVPLAARALGHP
ncbi:MULTISPECIES: Hint domain-containing protein [unclassified Yoonia]|uniref:Hint domain-containing protein n=1 Tax=unclassified Yoonia TaxID=2629118 RepID=UPI002AFED198|nr:MULTISPECIES: Hint domain-containing protein [unclassified Yoonia]